MSRRFFAVTVALTLVCSPAYAEQIIVFEDFESYNSDAELLAAWPAIGSGSTPNNGTVLTTDPDVFYAPTVNPNYPGGTMLTGQAAEFCGTSLASACGAGISGASTANQWGTPFSVAPSATHNVVVSFDLADDGLSNNKKLTLGLRYTDGGTTQNMIEMGLWNQDAPGFNVRTVNFPSSPNTPNPTWVNFNGIHPNEEESLEDIVVKSLPTPMSTPRAALAGVHRFEAVISTDQIVFTLDLFADGLENDPSDRRPGVGIENGVGYDARAIVQVNTSANGFNDLRFGIPSATGSSGGDNPDAAFAAFDNIELKLVPIEPVDPTGNADFNEDGIVDGHDFLIWQRGFGIPGGANLGDGDANNDGNVDGADLAIWEGQFGSAPPAAIAAVPEPGGIALMLLALAGMTMRRVR